MKRKTVLFGVVFLLALSFAFLSCEGGETTKTVEIDTRLEYDIVLDNNSFAFVAPVNTPVPSPGPVTVTVTNTGKSATGSMGIRFKDNYNTFLKDSRDPDQQIAGQGSFYTSVASLPSLPPGGSAKFTINVTEFAGPTVTFASYIEPAIVVVEVVANTAVKSFKYTVGTYAKPDTSKEFGYDLTKSEMVETTLNLQYPTSRVGQETTVSIDGQSGFLYSSNSKIAEVVDGKIRFVAEGRVDIGYMTGSGFLIEYDDPDFDIDGPGNPFIFKGNSVTVYEAKEFWIVSAVTQRNTNNDGEFTRFGQVELTFSEPIKDLDPTKFRMMITNWNFDERWNQGGSGGVISPVLPYFINGGFISGNQGANHVNGTFVVRMNPTFANKMDGDTGKVWRLQYGPESPINPHLSGVSYPEPEYGAIVRLYVEKGAAYHKDEGTPNQKVDSFIVKNTVTVDHMYAGDGVNRATSLKLPVGKAFLTGNATGIPGWTHYGTDVDLTTGTANFLAGLQARDMSKPVMGLVLNPDYIPPNIPNDGKVVKNDEDKYYTPQYITNTEYKNSTETPDLPKQILNPDWKDGINGSGNTAIPQTVANPAYEPANLSTSVVTELPDSKQDKKVFYLIKKSDTVYSVDRWNGSSWDSSSNVTLPNATAAVPATLPNPLFIPLTIPNGAYDNTKPENATFNPSTIRNPAYEPQYIEGEVYAANVPDESNPGNVYLYKNWDSPVEGVYPSVTGYRAGDDYFLQNCMAYFNSAEFGKDAATNLKSNGRLFTISLDCDQKWDLRASSPNKTGQDFWKNSILIIKPAVELKDGKDKVTITWQKGARALQAVNRLTVVLSGQDKENGTTGKLVLDGGGDEAINIAKTGPTGNWTDAEQEIRREWIKVQSGGRLILDGGVILQNRVSDGDWWGGPILVGNEGGGILIINDATIQNNTAKGAITPNNVWASPRGGAISIINGGVVVMNGGTIKDNTAATTGGLPQAGAIMASLGYEYYSVLNTHFYMTGGSITGNKVTGTQTSAGVFTGGVFQKTGGTISGNDGTLGQVAVVMKASSLESTYNTANTAIKQGAANPEDMLFVDFAGTLNGFSTTLLPHVIPAWFTSKWDNKK